MQAMSIFLSGFIGLIGLIIGLVVSSAAREELKDFSKTFIIVRNYFFILAASLLFFQAGIMVFFVSMFLLVVIIKEFAPEDTSKIIIVLYMIMLILTVNTMLFPLLASVLLLIGVLEAGVWASSQKTKKGFFTREVFRSFMQSHILYVILPFALIVFL